MNPQDYTVAQLKELLKAMNLPTAGSKADLISRLQENDPELWQTAEKEVPLTIQEPLCDAGPQQNATRGEDSIANRELELIRRERDLLRRELELMRLEAERGTTSASGSRSPGTSEGANYYHPRGLKDMLSEFDGASNTFRNWKQQS